jgi:acyl-CoA reductase-like NAD-dependent aldehyde dehydrogenase
MMMASQKELENIASQQRDFFFNRGPKETAFRIKQFNRLKKAIEESEQHILKALKRDLNKPETEAYVSEIAPVIKEIDYALKNLSSWVKAKKVRTPFLLFPGSSHIYSEPYGSVLIIAPWNYPFQLAMVPLVGAMAAGNCAVLKPSEMAPHTSRIIAELMGKYFEPSYIMAVEGGVEATQHLLSQKFDYLFFTGGTAVGKIVMKAAASHLTPVTLELGGKNPCIVDSEVDIVKTARRIVWGKFFNAGQTCLAPDYLAVHTSIKRPLLEAIGTTVEAFYGRDPSKSPDYARIINQKHFTRLSSLLKEGEIIIGGRTNPENLYIAPTVIDKISWNSKIMEDEIFGPILPVIEFEDCADVVTHLRTKPKPLVLYFFSRIKRNQETILHELSSGGVSLNDTFGHFENIRLPFGGVGESGMGAYHGKTSFDTFSHKKSVFKRSFLADPSMKYPPYKTPLKYLKKTLKFLSW